MSPNHRGIKGAFRRRLSIVLLALGALVSWAPLLVAQDYPARPVKVIVPFPAGGTADVMPRIFADWLSRKWGQAGRGRESERRRRQYRSGDGVQVGAGRLHAPFGAAAAARDQPESLPQARLRSARIRPDHHHGAGTERARGKSEGRRQQRRRADRLCQGQSRQAHLRHPGQRHDLPSHLRNVSDDCAR